MTGFPGLGLLRALRPTPSASTGDRSSRPQPWLGSGEGPTRWFPRSFLNPLTGSAPNYAPATSLPLRRRHSRQPPSRRHQPAPEFPEHVGCALQPSPDLSDSSWWSSLERLSVAGSSRTPFRLASRTPHHLTVLMRSVVVRAASTLPGVPRIRLPSASLRPLRRTKGGVLPHRKVQERLVALDVGEPEAARPIGCEHSAD